MRVVVDFDLCESNGVCVSAVPEVFELGDDDFLTVLMERPPDAMRAKLQAAVSGCPKQAISLVED